MYLCGRTNNAQKDFEHNVHLPIIHFLGFAFGGVVNGRKYLLTIDFRLSTVNKYLSMLKQCLRFGQLCWKRPMQSKFNWFN